MKCVYGESPITHSCYPTTERRRMATLFHRKQWLTLPDRELRDTCQRAIDPHAVTLSKDKKQHALQIWARYRLKPAFPTHPQHWLSNSDLVRVLAPRFHKRATLDMCLHHQIPFVHPTQKHGKHGFVVYDDNHWMAVWQDDTIPSWFFFDSECDRDRMPRNVKKGWKRAQRHRYQVRMNQKKFQHRPGECGMFVVYFLFHCLLHAAHTIDALSITDADMREFRNVVFS